MSTIGEVILISSTHFQTEFNAISLFGVELDANDSFVDYFEPDEPFVLHFRQAEVASGTLLSECLDEMKSIRIGLKRAELLLAKGRGDWDFDDFLSKVVGIPSVLVLVESEVGIDGGFAAVPFPAEESREVAYAADPEGASFVFSLRPTAARYPLEDDAREAALEVFAGGFAFGLCCLGIVEMGLMGRNERNYTVPSGWNTGRPRDVSRFEVWRVALSPP